MRKRSWDRIWLYLAPFFLAAVAFASLSLTFRSGPEFPTRVESGITSQTQYLANFARLSFQAQDTVAEEIETIKGINNFGSYANLQNDIYNLSLNLPNTSCLLVQEGDSTIYSKGAPIGLRSASGQKLVTALAALLVLGEDYRYTTEVRAFSSPVNGILEGNLYIVGSGDPLLWTDDFFRYRNTISPGLNRTSLDSLANQLVGSGLRSITGAVFGVETRYDALRYPPSWPAAFRSGAVAGALSALSIDHAYVLQNNNWVGVAEPALTGAGVFDDLLEARGVVVPFTPSTSTLTPPVLLASVTSPPLKDILQTILSVSDNTAAELLVKEIGLVGRGEPTTQGGIHAAVDALVGAGVFSGIPEILPGDGSGVAVTNRTTCKELTTVLEYAEENYSLSSLLAVAGENGTLRNRFKDSDVQGRLFAKTGSWAGVSSLSGYVLADNGRRINFSYISNDSRTGVLSSSEKQMLETDLGEVILNYLNN